MTFANKEVSTLFSLSSRFNLSLCYTWIVFVARGRTNTSTVSFSARRTRTSGDKGGGGVGRRVNEFLSSKLDPVCIQSLLLCTGLDLHSILIHSFIHSFIHHIPIVIRTTRLQPSKNILKCRISLWSFKYLEKTVEV